MKKKSSDLITEVPPPAEPDRQKRTAPALEFLPVPYTDSQILVMADSMARYSVEKQNLEEQFEVVKMDFKHKLEAIDASIRTLTRNITKRSHYENVDCIYVLEEPTHAEKTLVRMDTGEVVRVLPMDPRDYQDSLPAVMRAADPVDTTSFALEPPDDRKTAAAGDKETPAPPLQ